MAHVTLYKSQPESFFYCPGGENVQPHLPVATLTDGEQHVGADWCLTFLLIWLRCGRRPDLSLGSGPIQSHFLRRCHIIFCSHCCADECEWAGLEQSSCLVEDFCMSSHLFLVSGEPKRWLNFV